MTWEYYLHNWDSMTSYYKLKDLESSLETLRNTQDPEKAHAIIYSIESFIMLGQTLAEVTIPIIRCLLNILAKKNPANQVAIADLLSVIFGGRGPQEDKAAGKPNFHRRCAEEIALGFPIYLSIIENDETGNGREFLEILVVSTFGNPKLKERAVAWLKTFQRRNPLVWKEVIEGALEEIETFDGTDLD